MRLALLTALAVPALLAPATPAAADLPYMVGVGKVDITPPAYDPAQDAGQFPLCNTTAFGGERQFAFEEPFVDADQSHDFNYPQGVAEPYCDANQNGRWDGIYISGGVDHLADQVHDPIDARAIAISDGTHTVVIVSAAAQGLFENYIDQMRAEAKTARPGIDDVVVSANHNESSPDTIGIYGAPPVPEQLPGVGGAVGENSGIDDYYMDFLVDKIAELAVDAYDDRQPASLWATDFQVNEGDPPLPDGVRVDLSHNFPTTNDDRSPAAVDPKVRVLQARDASGSPIATVMNLAAHNQEIGHSDEDPYDISSDWPGFFHDRLEQDIGAGMAMFLVGDNGSEEDPETVPAVGCPEAPDACYAQAEATGVALADAVSARLQDLAELRAGTVASRRDVFFAPLENNLFKAAAAAGLFGERQLYTNGVPTGHTGEDLKTSVAVVDVGPDLQFLANPGEAFPALMLGSPWGIDEVGCPERPNPPVPTWRASAGNRFQIGLADDMIGYEIPAWAFSSLPGAFNYEGPPDMGGPATCVNDIDDNDPAGHQHKLETEGAGPTASNLVANNLAELLDQSPDPAADLRLGRFVYRDGSLSRLAQRPDGSGGSEDAVAVWLTHPGSTSLSPGSGTIVAVAEVGAFGDRPVDQAGAFMDYDGQGQDAPDITTRGMLVGPASEPGKRYYLNVYPSLDTTPLDVAKDYCDDVAAPSSALDPDSVRARRHVFRLAGTASDAGCDGGADHASRPGEVKSVDVAVSKRLGGHVCRFLHSNGRLGRRVGCARRRWLPARGSERWRLSAPLARPLPEGRYRARSRATDAAGNVERGGPANLLRFRVE